MSNNHWTIRILDRIMILNHHPNHVFFFGDLNYRLNYGSQGNDRSPSKELFDRMVQHIQHGDIARLFKHDQLQEELQNGRLLSGFC